MLSGGINLQRGKRGREQCVTHSHMRDRAQSMNAPASATNIPAKTNARKRNRINLDSNNYDPRDSNAAWLAESDGAAAAVAAEE